MKPRPERSPVLRVLAALGGIAIAAGLVLAVDALGGDPLSRAWAERRALRYAQARYPDQDFFIRSSWGGANFVYGATLQSRQSADTAFDVTTRFWFFTSGREQEMVENRGTTLSRQGAEGAAAIETILDRACPEYERLEVYNTALSGELQSVELDLCWTPEDPQGGAGEQADLFPLDAPFDPAVTARVPDRLCAQILWDGEPAEADFEAVADAFDAALTAAGYDIDYYDLTLVPRDAGHEELQTLDLDRLIRK